MFKRKIKKEAMQTPTLITSADRVWTTKALKPVTFCTIFEFAR